MKMFSRNCDNEMKWHVSMAVTVSIEAVIARVIQSRSTSALYNIYYSESEGEHVRICKSMVAEMGWTMCVV